MLMPWANSLNTQKHCKLEHPAWFQSRNEQISLALCVCETLRVGLFLKTSWLVQRRRIDKAKQGNTHTELENYKLSHVNKFRARRKLTDSYQPVSHSFLNIITQWWDFLVSSGFLLWSNIFFQLVIQQTLLFHQSVVFPLHIKPQPHPPT